MNNQDTIIYEDTSIDYTDNDRNLKKYTYENVLRAAKAIKVDKNMGPLKLENVHRARHTAIMTANDNRMLSLAEYNYELSKIMQMEISADRK